jgi:hypothetical protein
MIYKTIPARYLAKNKGNKKIDGTAIIKSVTLIVGNNTCDKVQVDSAASSKVTVDENNSLEKQTNQNKK